ncbi:MAG: class I adenylate-forming enzyme family protein [Polaromonas sp.]|jgi:acyl-CoA synthetase (AMP-forming)/AMP-acid ligase II
MLTGDMLRRSARRFPHKAAVIRRQADKRTVISCGQLDERASQLAHALLAPGLNKGSKVAMLSRNLAAYGAVFFGAARTGYVLNNASVLYAPDELAWVLNKSETQVLIFDAQFADKVAAVAPDCPQMTRYIAIGPSEPGGATFDTFIQNQPIFFKMAQGWGLSGDIGVMDVDGFSPLIDRAKDMLISGGENVYPKEIEQVLYLLPDVAECAVFGIPDDKWGEVPAAYILLKAGFVLTQAQVVSQCEAKLARLKRPRLVKFVDSFAKTPIGKIRKNLLKEPCWLERKKI